MTRRPNPAHCLFLCGPFLNGWGGKRIKRILHDIWKWYEIQISVSINKPLSEHDLAHLFTRWLRAAPSHSSHERSRHTLCEQLTSLCTTRCPDAITARNGSNVTESATAWIFFFFFFLLVHIHQNKKQKRAFNVPLLRHNGMWVILIHQIGWKSTVYYAVTPWLR